MTVGNRLVLACLALGACIVAGCGGGSGGSPSGSPTAAAAVASRPLAAGDTFAYAGTTKQTQVFNVSSPAAQSTVTSQVAQSIVVSGPTTYNGLAGAFDFKTAETDTAPLQQTQVTTNTYYGTKASSLAGFTDFVSSGSTSSDSLGERTTVTLGAGNELVDILPETSGESWTNDGAQTIVTNEADGTSETRTYAAGGSYDDTTTYPQSSQFTPQPAPLTATIVENGDGSGRYSLPLFGSSPNVTISFGTPDPSNHVPIVVGDPAPIETADPVAFFTPGPLYKESNVDNVGRPIPAACGVGASFGTVGNALVQTAQRIDTVLGTIESLSQTSYVIPKYGVACIQLTDTTNAYYDYSGQSNVGLAGISFAGGVTPTEVDTITTTLGLTSGTVQSMSLHAGSATAGTGFAIANARANFVATVDRARLRSKKRAIAHLRAALLRAYPGITHGGK
jgi:hypothetical protein